MSHDGSPPERRAPLDGIRILDLTRVLAGPFCTMTLGDLGADVVKIEEPGHGDVTRGWGPPFVGPDSAYFISVNRNKRSLTLDLRDGRAREIFLTLSRTADIVIENFKVGTLERLGVGYDRLQAENPRLIYCSITGFGSDGPYADRPGYDLIALGMGGMMSVTGEPDGEPMKVGVAVADLAAGMYACAAIQADQFERERSGLGQHVEAALLDSTVGWLTTVGSSYLVSGELPKRYGNTHPNIVPYQVFRARDRHFTVAVGTDGQFAALCDLIRRTELAKDPRFVTNGDRLRNRELLVTLLNQAFAAQDAETWTDLLLARGIPSGPINDVAQVFADPQVHHREMVVDVEMAGGARVKLAGIPIKMAATPGVVRRPPPRLGEHTDEILTDLGVSADELASLRARSAI
jgi:formyl-CoA transferase